MKYRVLLMAAAFLAMSSFSGFAQVISTGGPGGGPSDVGPPEGAGVSPFILALFEPGDVHFSPFLAIAIDLADDGILNASGWPDATPDASLISSFTDPHSTFNFPQLVLGIVCGNGVYAFGVHGDTSHTPLQANGWPDATPDAVTSLVDFVLNEMSPGPTSEQIIGQLIREFVIDIGSAGVDNPRADGGGLSDSFTQNP